MSCTGIFNFVESFDILGIQESKTDDTDNICIPGYQIFYNNRESESELLLVTRQNDNHSPGPGPGRLVPSSHQRSELSNTIFGTFSRGDKSLEVHSSP